MNKKVNLWRKVVTLTVWMVLFGVLRETVLMGNASGGTSLKDEEVSSSFFFGGGNDSSIVIWRDYCYDAHSLQRIPSRYDLVEGIDVSVANYHELALCAGLVVFVYDVYLDDDDMLVSAFVDDGTIAQNDITLGDSSLDTFRWDLNSKWIFSQVTQILL